MGFADIVGADDVDSLIDSLASGGDSSYGDDVLELLGVSGDEDGAGLDEIVGADLVAGVNPTLQALIRKLGGGNALAKQQKAAKARASLASKLKLAALMRQRPTVVTQKHEMIGTDLPVTFVTANIAPGGTQLVQIVAPTIWKPQDLIIPSDIASVFAITSLTMGIFTWNPGGAPLRLLSFTEEATTRRSWKLPTLQPGQTINMTIQNVSPGTTAPAYGEWWGKMVG
jgi:hypothetical protein